MKLGLILLLNVLFIAGVYAEKGDKCYYLFSQCPTCENCKWFECEQVDNYDQCVYDHAVFPDAVKTTPSKPINKRDVRLKRQLYLEASSDNVQNLPSKRNQKQSVETTTNEADATIIIEVPAE